MSSDLPTFPCVDAVIFDFDGVLVESVEIKTEAFRQLFQPFGEEVTARVVEHHNNNAGVSRFEKIRLYYRDYIGRPLDEAGVADLAEEFGALVEELVVAAAPVAGAGELLDDLLNAGIPAFVASATPEEELKRIIERRGMTGYFRGIFGSPTTKIEAATRVVRSFDLDPRRVVFIGDALADFNAARATGCRFLGRVPPGAVSLFPQGTAIVESLLGFGRAVASAQASSDQATSRDR